MLPTIKTNTDDYSEERLTFETSGFESNSLWKLFLQVVKGALNKRKLFLHAPANFV